MAGETPVLRHCLVAACVIAALVAGCKKSAPSPAPLPAPPPGMVYIPGGQTRIGSNDGLPQEQPVFTADVKPFFLDIHPVTVAQYRAFVQATGHITHAETYGDSGVFDFETGEWSLVKGATWHHPFGPDQPAAPDDHPVTQVSWIDAVAYCEWAGKRLPTEVEWEHAARNAKNGGPTYAWGDSLVIDGRYMANTWQGQFPKFNTAADGYLGASPVGAFGATPLGLTDMGGNVWEWVDDWFRPYSERGKPYEPTAESKKVQRGGSFLCDPAVCHGYRVSGRADAPPDEGLCHTGFRCARDAPVQ